MGKSWSAQRGNEGRRGAGVPSGRQAQAGRVSARGHRTLGGRAKSTGSRASGTSSSTSRRRALHTFLASAASAAIRAIAEARPDYPLAAGRDLKPRGAGRSHAEPPRPRLLGGRESGVGGDKEQGRGPRAPTPQTHTTLGALDSGGKWGENQVGLKASALSPQFRPFGTDHAAVTHKWPRVTGLAASSRLGGWWEVEMR